jgi:predicted transcriptional regulator
MHQITEIYLEPGDSEAIQPTPTMAANTSMSPVNNGMPAIPVKKAVEVTAGGAAVISCAYIFFKFFGIGAVTRASGRLYKNKNRNDLFKFIADNPGVTLHDLAHGLDMNLGTIRDHLLVLGLNHRIVSSKFNDKFVRYFTNSGSFTKNEQLVISVARREGMKKVLSLLLNKPGLTNAQISSSLDIQVSATSRYTRELLEKGLIIKL